MKHYFVFSDECGLYEKNRSSASIVAHPFYVRSSIIIDIDDYIKLDLLIAGVKNAFGISSTQEVKWQHYGNLIKNNAPDYLDGFTCQTSKSALSK